MLQWTGGSRRKVTTSTKSTQKRQKQYFEQRKRQQQWQQVAGLERGDQSGAENKRHRSLDVLGLVNLSSITNECSIFPDENPTPKEDASMLPDDECFVFGCKSVSNVGREQIDYPDITKGKELCVLSLLEDHLPGEQRGNLSRQEAHVAFSVPGLGKVQARTPRNSSSCVSLFEAYPSSTKSTEFLLDDFDFGEVTENSISHHRKRRGDGKKVFERNGILEDGWNGSRFALKEGAGAGDFSDSWNSRLWENEDEMTFGEGKFPAYFDGCDGWFDMKDGMLRHPNVSERIMPQVGSRAPGDRSNINVDFFCPNGSEESCSSSSAVMGGVVSKLAMAGERGRGVESGSKRALMFGDGCHPTMEASAFPFPCSAELHIDAKLVFGNVSCDERQRKVTMRAPLPEHFVSSSYAAFDNHPSQALQADALLCRKSTGLVGETSNIHHVFDLKW